MTFTVTYRDKSGGKASIELDAPDRNALWAELEKRGISPVSVREGKAGKAGGRLSPARIAAVAAAAAAAIAIVAWMVLKSGAPEGKARDAAPAAESAGGGGRKAPARAAAKAPPAQAEPEKTAQAEPERPAAAAPAKGAEEKPKANPRRAPSTAKKYPRRVIARRPEPPQRFKYDSDDLIGAYLEIVPGTQMEGGLRFDKIGRDFEKSLEEDVALAEGQDSEYNRQLREYVRETKKEILEVMRRENKTFGQVMEEQFNQLIELGQYKRDLEQELREIRKSGEYTAEEYEMFVAASNKMLESKGCSPLKIPKATYYQLERYRKLREAQKAERNGKTKGDDGK